MSSYRCQHCGAEEAIFGSGGGSAIAAEYDTALLASLPLELSTRELTDQGKPIVLAAPDSDAAKRYLTLATEVIQAIEASPVNPEPKISILDD
jgi:ATP-binding protein involved in chromosome partitioning